VAFPLDVKASGDAEGDTIDYRGREAVIPQLAPHLDRVRGHRCLKNQTFPEFASETVCDQLQENLRGNERVGGEGGVKETVKGTFVGKSGVEGISFSTATVSTRRNESNLTTKYHSPSCVKKNAAAVEGYVACYAPSPWTKPSAPSATVSGFVVLSSLLIL
jgi:hypothetical protein